jgi:eukaryotic-like serine/threonine-protein kinase
MRRGASGRRPGVAAIVLALVFIALAVATIAGAVLSGGDDDNGSTGGADRTPAEPAQPDQAQKQKKEPKQKTEPKAKKEPKEPAAAPAPSDGQYDPARGAELNSQGFDLMSQERYDEAVPVLQQAVESFPPGTQDVNYAYALFNLGKSLRLAGRPDEAIPVLEQRLEIPNQTETVQRELDLARQQADEG